MAKKLRGKRGKFAVDSIPKARPWLPNGVLASGVQYCGCEQGRVYTAVVQFAKMEILVKIKPVVHSPHVGNFLEGGAYVRGETTFVSRFVRHDLGRWSDCGQNRPQF